jgi:hypothetical protein
VARSTERVTVTITHEPDTGKAPLFRDGVITGLVLILVFLALDDITTDNAKTFRVEYSALVACAAWSVYVVVRLLRRGHRIRGTVSAFALFAGLWAARAVVHGGVPGFWTEYVVLTAAYLWFWVVTVTLLWPGRRQPPAGQGAIA